MTTDSQLDLVEENRRLRLELAHVRREVRTLRKRAGGSDTTQRRLDRAHEDAVFLLGLHVAGEGVSRSYCYGHYGLSERRFTHALGLLRLADIYGVRGWRYDDYQTALDALQRAYGRAVRYPLRWVGRLPQRYIKEYWGRAAGLPR